MVKNRALVLYLLFMMLLILLRPAGAEETVRLSELGTDLSDEFYMLTAVDMLAQGLAKGGLLVFDKDMNYLYGWSTADTPDDFFTSVPPSTLSLGLVLPVQVIEGLYLTLGDSASYAVLEGLVDEGHLALVAIVLCKAEGEVLLEEALYNTARRQIEDASVAGGLDPQELYELYESEGTTKEELTGRVISGERPSDIVLGALSIRKKNVKTQESGRIPAAFVAICALACIILALWALMGRARDRISRD